VSLPHALSRALGRPMRRARAGAAAGWVDPTGLSWDAAWDLGAGAGGDIPALGGGDPLVLGGTAGYSVAATPDYVTPENYGLTGAGAADFVWGSTLTATVPALTAGTGLRVRWLTRYYSDAGVDNRYTLTIGDPAVRALRVSQDNLSDYGRVYLQRFVGGALVGSALVSVPWDQWVLIDASITDTGSGSAIELRVNGQYAATFLDASSGWEALSTGIVSLVSMRGPSRFLAVEQSNVPVTEAEHAAALEALMDGVLFSVRSPVHRWDFTTLASGTDDLIDMGTAASPVTVPYLSGDPAVLGQPTTGASAAAIGSARVDRGVTSAGAIFRTPVLTPLDASVMDGALFTLRYIGSFKAVTQQLMQVGRYIGGDNQMQYTIYHHSSGPTIYTSCLARDDTGRYGNIGLSSPARPADGDMCLVDLAVRPRDDDPTLMVTDLKVNGVAKTYGVPDTPWLGLTAAGGQFWVWLIPRDGSIVYEVRAGVVSEAQHQHDYNLLVAGQ
jgi:hypothetical protein